MAKNRIAGTVFLSVNGVRKALVGNVKIEPGTPMREEQQGPVETNGYKETSRAAKIECELSFRSDLDFQAEATIDDATVSAELANGKVFVLSEAWASGDWNIENEEGKISAQWTGIRGEFA